MKGSELKDSKETKKKKKTKGDKGHCQCWGGPFLQDMMKTDPIFLVLLFHFVKIKTAFYRWPIH